MITFLCTSAFYQNKQIQFFTMGSPGGGYDAYTRAVGARLQKATGARVVTVNEPAAGGLVAMNRLLVAKPDGLSLLLVGGEALSLASLMGEPGVNYDLLGQTWLARVSAENKVALIGPKAPFKTLADIIASERPVVWAGSGKADGNSDFQSILAYATGMKAKMIIGSSSARALEIYHTTHTASLRPVNIRPEGSLREARSVQFHNLLLCSLTLMEETGCVATDKLFSK